MADQDVLGAKIQELQVLERNLSNYSLEKQNFQIELNGVNNALDELKTAKDEVYKIVGGLMIKSNKDALTKELNEKKKILDIRISTIEKQEKVLDEKIEKIKKEVNSSIASK